MENDDSFTDNWVTTHELPTDELAWRDNSSVGKVCHHEVEIPIRLVKNDASLYHLK